MMSVAAVLLERMRHCAKTNADSVQFLGEEKFNVERGYFVAATQNTVLKNIIYFEVNITA